MVRIGMCETAYETDFVHRFGHFWKHLANIESGHIGGDGTVFPADLSRRFRLEIERIEMRHAAPEKDQHHRFCRGRRAFLVSCARLAPQQRR